MPAPAAPFPAAYSTLSAQALAAWVQARYACTGPVTCTLLRRGLNDTYRVTGLATGLAGQGRAVLRVYRSAWRSPGEVEWKLGLLRHLAGAGCAVSAPCPQLGGAQWEVLEAVEGPRVAALFEWVEGRWLEAVPGDAAASLGVKSGKAIGEGPSSAAFRVAEHGTKGIKAAPEQTFGWIAVVEAA